MVAAVFALHLLLRIRGGFQPPPESARLSELGLGAGALFAGMGLLVAVLLFVDRLGTRPLDQGSTGREMERIVGETLPVYIDGSKLLEMRACHFDWGAPALDLAKFIGPETPFLGKADGVPVIVFFDPNCPHCRDYYPVFLRVVAKYRDRMRFTLLPRLLWDESIPQAEALRVAESSGKYFELWKAMFDKQPGPGKGMTVAEIAELFRRLGIDDNGLDQRLAAARPAVIGLRDRAREAGVDAVPAVYIGGRRVWGPNRGEDCLGTLIERMLSGTVKPVEDAAPQ
jgi:predicted DsbA family dithiol-disulfide isomerase